MAKNIREYKYIEKKFPIAEINRICVSERIALKPIYMMHRIFARRIGSVFRTIILGALKDDSVNIMEEFYKSHRTDPDTNDITILDPMCGGGTTLIEGSRLGAKVIGFEINPIPWFITKCEMSIVDVDKLIETYKNLEITIGRKIKEMYKTKCPHCGEEGEIIYVFWIKKVKCPNCNKEIQLFKDYIITYDKKEENFYLVCPNCLDVFHTTSLKEETTCPTCGNVFNPKNGVVVKNNITCPYCSHKFRLIDVLKQQDEPLDAIPYAIDGFCHNCERRFIKKFDENDWKILKKVEEVFEENKSKLLFPRDEIPDGYNTNQMKKHNYKYWYQMFNKRQLLALSLLLEEIKKIEPKEVRDIFLLTFSETLRANNMFCYYDKRWAKQITPLFSRKDFAPVNFPLEQNVWGGKYGRGSFRQVFERVLKGKEFNLKPYERLYTKKGTKRIYLDEKIGEKEWAVYCMDAQNLDKIVKDKVDLVITDPPYFDSINYSEVYEFFYVWLKLALDYECFKNSSAINQNEAIVNEIQNKDKEHFKKILTNIFRKSADVLKDNGMFIFTFHDFSKEAWVDMLEIVKNADLSVKKIHFYHGENVSAGHFGGQKSVFDGIWVCKKEEMEKVSISVEESIDLVWKEINHLIDEIKKGKYFKLDENDIKIFVYGKCVEIYEKYNLGISLNEFIDIALNKKAIENALNNVKKPKKVLITDFI
ncbi:MAG: hypothetical protein GXN95_01820 [Methanococci archaeon]|nr:hypothetical protein [Methanococci archaeon]